MNMKKYKKFFLTMILGVLCVCITGCSNDVDSGKFVTLAVSGGQVAHSTDGINWAEGTLPIDAGVNWTSVCYGNGKFVAVGGNSTNANDIGAYSTDGIHWIDIKMPEQEPWKSVCYGNGKFVAIAQSDASAYSYDGSIWFSGEGLPHSDWNNVCYGIGIFIAVGEFSMAYSPDGIHWEEITSTVATSEVWMSVCYGKGRFVAVTPDYMAVSTDGINWSSEEVLGNWKGICYGNGRFVTISEGSDKVAYSTDGIKWKDDAKLPTTAVWQSFCYGNGKFVAVGFEATAPYDGIAAYSTDGISWTPIEEVFTDKSALSSITYGFDGDIFGFL